MFNHRLLWLGIACAGLLFTGCHKAPQNPATATANVQVAQPIAKRLSEWDEFTGRLSPVASVEVRARVSGYIESTHFKEGTQVKKDDLLFVIDPRRYNAELARAEAEHARARATLELSISEAERAVKLVETRSISMEESVAKAKSRQGAEAALKAAQAAVDAAKLEVEFTRVTAPISGRISRKMVTEGNLITGGPSGATVLTSIVQLDPIYCYFDVDERSALKYRSLAREGKRTSALYQPIDGQMGLADEEGFPHPGKIDYVDNEISATTGSIKARGIFPNPDHLMSPGFFARVRIPGSGDYDALLIRDTAIGSDQGRPFVFVVGADGIATRRSIVLGQMEEGLRIVREGLNPDQRIVVNGLLSVRHGTPVKAEEVPMKPAEVVTAGTP